MMKNYESQESKSTPQIDSRYWVEQQGISQGIDLIELWNHLWKNKWLIIGTTFAFAVGAVIYALSLTNIYRAEAVLAAADKSQGIGAIAGGLGGAANLLGIDVGGEVDSIANAIAILRSRDFVRQFIDKHDLMVPLMASKWSREEGRNVINPEIYDVETGIWLRDAVPPEPTYWQAFAAFSNIYSVQQERPTGLVRIAIEWPDAAQAAEWVNWLVSDINAHVKEEDLQEARNAVEFLQRQLQVTQLVEMQKIFYELIESQTRTIMLADVREEYIFKVIDHAVVPETKERPSRSLICIVITMLGGMLSVAFVLTREYLRVYNDAQLQSESRVI